MKFTTLKEALAYIGGLTKPSKMPCDSYNIPAQECKIGSKLRLIKGTVCATCYALKGLYKKYEKTVLPSQYKRLATIDSPFWAAAFIFIINRKKMPFFRWHDSGDVQSVSHFTKICEIAKNCSSCLFWLPTREYSIISTYKQNGGVIPENLIVRLSAYKVGQTGPINLAHRLGVHTSSVKNEGEASCPAYKQGGKCLDCRACWDKDIFEISYPLH